MGERGRERVGGGGVVAGGPREEVEGNQRLEGGDERGGDRALPVSRDTGSVARGARHRQGKGVRGGSRCMWYFLSSRSRAFPSVSSLPNKKTPVGPAPHKTHPKLEHRTKKNRFKL